MAAATSSKVNSTKSVGGLSAFQNPLAQSSMAAEDEFVMDIYGSTRTDISGIQATTESTLGQRQNNETGSAGLLQIPDEGRTKKYSFLPSGMSPVVRRQIDDNADKKETNQQRSSGRRSGPSTGATNTKYAIASKKTASHVTSANKLTPAETDASRGVLSTSTSVVEHSSRSSTPKLVQKTSARSVDEVGNNKRRPAPLAPTQSGLPSTSGLETASKNEPGPKSKTNQSASGAAQLFAGKHSVVDRSKLFEGAKTASSTTSVSRPETSASRTRAAEIDTSKSIVRSADFRQRLEAIMSSRGSPASSSLSSPSKANGQSNNANKQPRASKEFEAKRQLPAASSIEIGRLDTQRAGTIISQLFRKALENYEGDGPSDIFTDSLTSSSKPSVYRDFVDGSRPEENRFRFPISGIDVPADDSSGSTAVEGTDAERADLAARLAKIHKGFSYLPDRNQAAEVTRRAVDVTSRRPHEAIESKATSPRDPQSSEEVAILKEARARLHHSEPPPPPPLPAGNNIFPVLNPPAKMMARTVGTNEVLKEMLSKVRERNRKLQAENGTWYEEDEQEEEDLPPDNHITAGYAARQNETDVKPKQAISGLDRNTHDDHRGNSGKAVNSTDVSGIFNGGNGGRAMLTFPASSTLSEYSSRAYLLPSSRASATASTTSDVRPNVNEYSSVRPAIPARAAPIEPETPVLSSPAVGSIAAAVAAAAVAADAPRSTASARILVPPPGEPIVKSLYDVPINGSNYSSVAIDNNVANGYDGIRIETGDWKPDAATAASERDESTAVNRSISTTIWTGNGPTNGAYYTSTGSSDLDSPSLTSGTEDVALASSRRVHSGRRLNGRVDKHRSRQNEGDSLGKRSPRNSHVTVHSAAELGNRRSTASAGSDVPLTVRISGPDSFPRQSSVRRRTGSSLDLSGSVSARRRRAEERRRQTKYVGYIRNPEVVRRPSRRSRSRNSDTASEPVINVRYKSTGVGDWPARPITSVDGYYSEPDIVADAWPGSTRSRWLGSSQSLNVLGGTGYGIPSYPSPAQLEIRPIMSPLFVHPVEQADFNAATARSPKSIKPSLVDVGKHSRGSYFVQLALNPATSNHVNGSNGGGMPGYTAVTPTFRNGSNTSLFNGSGNGYHLTPYAAPADADVISAAELLPTQPQKSRVFYVHSEPLNDFDERRQTYSQNVASPARSTELEARPISGRNVFVNGSSDVGVPRRPMSDTGTGSHVIKSIAGTTHHNGDAIVEFDLELTNRRQLPSSKFNYVDTTGPASPTQKYKTYDAEPTPDFVMQLYDTMTMDFGVDSVNAQPRHPASHQRRRNRRDASLSSNGVADQAEGLKRLQSATKATHRAIPVQTSYNGKDLTDQLDDDLANYLSTVDEDETDHIGGWSTSKPSSELPRVVRGSILIRNAIDTTGGPRHIDVVTPGDSAIWNGGDSSEWVDVAVEDNTNMFDGLYRQSRENPVYVSDPEQSADDVDGVRGSRKLDRRKGNRPTAREVFKETVRVGGSDDGFDNEIPIGRKRNVSTNASNNRSRDRLESRQTTSQSIPTVSRSSVSSNKGVRQTVDVHREEEEVIGSLPVGSGSSSAPDSSGSPAANAMINVDEVSEKVDVSFEDGVARLTVCVRCQRVVPIRGSSDLFKKSAVVVTRRIEIDLLAGSSGDDEDERRRLYERISRGGGTSTGGTGSVRHLDSKDTFELYKQLMSIADRADVGHNEQMRIDRLLEEETRRRVYAEISPLDLGEVDESNDSEILRRPAKDIAVTPTRPSSGTERVGGNTASNRDEQRLHDVLVAESDATNSFYY